MDAGTLSIKTIFGQDRRHVVPLFQRPYVWRKDLQWEPLWNDIQAVADRLLLGLETRPHFLGAIVLDNDPKPTGYLETRLIIDGQQRLTTIQLLLEAFCDHCAVVQAEKYYKALLKLTRNDDPMSVEEEDQFKVWPTNVDQDHFRRVMKVTTPKELKEAYGRKVTVEEVGHPIADGYLYFSRVISEWLTAGADGPEEAERRLDTLYTTVREYVRMVVIDLGKDDDPQLIFETLNARGTPLLPSDLVKNFLFHRTKAMGMKLEPLYGQYWKPFDADSDYWRKELGIGHAARARIDSYLQNFLTLKRGDTIQVGHLYNAFRDYVVEKGAPQPMEILQEMSAYAQVFRSLDRLPRGSRECSFMARLEAMDLLTAYPFLLKLFHLYGKQQEILLPILDDLESFLVRRMICQLQTRGYGTFFVSLLGALEGSEGTPVDRVRAQLLTGTSEGNRWPNDNEFEAAWVSMAFYRILVRRRVRIILEALERQIFSDLSEKIEFGEKLTVEHLMPQSWHTHWPLPEGQPREEAIIRREKVLHTIGNLTLVNKKLNPSISNGPWESKREGINKHSVLLMNKDIVERTSWDEDAIKARTKELFEVAKEVWGRPTSS